MNSGLTRGDSWIFQETSRLHVESLTQLQNHVFTGSGVYDASEAEGNREYLGPEACDAMHKLGAVAK
jgi:hypothetical protein